MPPRVTEGNPNLDSELEKVRWSFCPVEAHRCPWILFTGPREGARLEHKLGLVHSSVSKLSKAWSGQQVSPTQGKGAQPHLHGTVWADQEV